MAITPAFIAKMVAVADRLTKSLQCTVTYTPFTGSSGTGKTYGSAVAKKAIVNMEQRQVRTLTGELTTCRASVVFFDTDLTISTDDKIVLPDGTTGPVLLVKGPVDPTSTHPYLTEVFLG